MSSQKTLTAEKVLLFQVGPVQDWIAQARTTRDLWSGSYLLSWLVANLVEKLRNDGTEFIFPALSKQVDEHAILLCVRGETLHEDARRKALIPNFPNRIVAGISTETETKLPSIIDAVFSGARESNSEWMNIAESCFNYLQEFPPFYRSSSDVNDTKRLWFEQVEAQWQVNWACFENGKNWKETYKNSVRLFDGRRQTRDFGSWCGAAGRNKDSFSGRQEALIGSQWLAEIRSKPGTKAKILQHLFRSNDELGASTIIKRVWHRSWLMAEKGFTPSDFNMPSIPGIAAFSWGADLIEDQTIIEPLADFILKVEESRDELDFDIPQLKKGEELVHDWFHRVDWEILQDSFWNSQIGIANAKRTSTERLRACSDNLRKLKKETPIGSPSQYYAVLALDGDSIGEWLSGSVENQPDLTPEFHLEFGGSMLDVSQNLIRDAVEHELNSKTPASNHKDAPAPIQGKLIYAGGDDVLALVPAGQAIRCANALRDQFVDSMEKIEGMPRGKISASAGIALGHIKAPLQDMIHEADAALGKAKSGRFTSGLKGNKRKNAVCVSIFRRSGSQSLWGAEFGSAALRLLDFLAGTDSTSNQPRPIYRQSEIKTDIIPVIPSRFPYRIAELLSPYAKESSHDSVDHWPEGLVDIATSEITWAIQQHLNKKDQQHVARKLTKLYQDYTAELAAKNLPISLLADAFLIEAFISRKD